MSISIPDHGLRIFVSVLRKEEFSRLISGNHRTSYILCSDGSAMEIEVKCFKLYQEVNAPNVNIELYLDGVLRNVVKPYTGRSMAELQFAEAKIDRGIVSIKVNGENVQIMKAFRFIDLDINDAPLNSRVVPNAGSIEVRIVSATEVAKNKGEEEDEQFEFESPDASVNDHGAISYLEGDLNNTIGIRFEEGNNHSLLDTKLLKLVESQKLMNERMGPLGEKKLFASFKFIYGNEEMLNHLGAIPKDHKLFDRDIASRRGYLSDETSEPNENKPDVDALSEFDEDFDFEPTDIDESIESRDNDFVAESVDSVKDATSASDHLNPSYEIYVNDNSAEYEGSGESDDDTETEGPKIPVSFAAKVIASPAMPPPGLATPNNGKRRARREDTPEPGPDHESEGAITSKISCYPSTPKSKRICRAAKSPKTPKNKKPVNDFGLPTPPDSASPKIHVKKPIKRNKKTSTRDVPRLSENDGKRVRAGSEDASDTIIVDTDAIRARTRAFAQVKAKANAETSPSARSGLVSRKRNS